MSSGTTSMTERDKKQRRVGLSLGVVAACLYLPFSWLLVEENNWSDYRMSWIILWPILPGILPGAFLFHPHDVAEFTTMGVMTLLLLAGLTWLGSLGWKRLLATAVIALLISIPSSMVAHSFYWF